MKHVNLNGQEESIKRFIMSLVIEPEGSVLELDGRPVACMMPVSAETNGNGQGKDDWTEAKNARRCELIDRELDGTLTADEQKELEDLQAQMLRHRHRVAPLPLAHARQLLEDLERKAAAAS